MKEYNHLKIEKKWQKEWEKKGIYHAKNNSKTPKFYGLIEFPYPSGVGMHAGHVRSNTAMDVISRKRRMEGFNVLYPIGWDAFGLPTENYAIKTGIHPIKVTKDNTDTFRRQLKALGFSFDWSREINTTDPKYYKWTQWIFLQFFKKGLAYKKRTQINWCPSCKIGLANEEVVDGKCERCGGITEKREKEQWMLAITKYADRLDKDLDTVNYLEKIKIQQRNWIGKSEGSEIDFKISSSDSFVKVFTTRPDTIFGATYLVLAPEHELIQKLKSQIENFSEVEKYILETKNKTEIDRIGEKIKTGVELKYIKAINPATKEEIPVWVADYVLANYGTGAIMAVPADDARDKEFADKFKLLIVENYKKAGFEDFGKKITTFKLRDWIFSRQRYWGEPIPLINCEKCGWIPVPEKDLPVKLPNIKKYQPTDSGESPLANVTKWVNVKCPKCKGKAKRETDTMPNWAGSSWYYLRYVDPKNNKEFASSKSLKYWNQVDWYNGGMEHTTLHLLYSRFWHKFLYDLKLVPTSEPYMKRTSHGMILADDGTKFSKSKGNGVDPEDVVKIYGADSFRLYEMFMGPFDQSVSWSADGMVGPRRFIERVWRLGEKVATQPKNTSPKPSPERRGGISHFPFQEKAGDEVVKLLHKTIKKVSEDIEEMRFNTAISSMMILATEMEKAEYVSAQDFKMFLQILSPFAPHVTEELWSMLGEKKSINLSAWPKWDESLIKDEEVKIVIQINGKVRSEIMIQVEASEDDVKKKVLVDETISRHMAGKEIKRFIYIKNRLVNIVF
ncbi:MAG: class I tRNA ligase family protein [bacterium]